MILNRDIVQYGTFGKIRLVQDRPEIQTMGLPVLFGPGGIEYFDVADRLGERPET